MSTLVARFASVRSRARTSKHARSDKRSSIHRTYNISRLPSLDEIMIEVSRFFPHVVEPSLPKHSENARDSSNCSRRDFAPFIRDNRARGQCRRVTLANRRGTNRLLRFERDALATTRSVSILITSGYLVPTCLVSRSLVLIGSRFRVQPAAIACVINRSR